MANAAEHIFDLVFGRWRSQILYAGVRLGIFDAVGDGAKSAHEVAAELHLDPPLTYRLLRALACLALLEEDRHGAFRVSAAGSLLRADHPHTLRGVVLLEEGPQHYALWKHLPAMIRDGRQNAFVREFARMAFEHAAVDAEYGEVFDAAMDSYSSMQTSWVLEALEDCDFSACTDVCDVGGGHGHLLCSVLARYPHLSGSVLERPSVIQDRTHLWADRLHVEDRCAFVPGDMFEAVPPADVYLMKLILHDWNDDECVRILQVLRAASRAGGRVFVIEHLVPEPEVPHFAKLFDIHMMCWGTGRERTVEEYEALFRAAKWKPAGTRYPRSRLMGVVEGAAN